MERSLFCCSFTAAEAHAYEHKDHKKEDWSEDATKDFIECNNDFTSRNIIESEFYEYIVSVSLKVEEEGSYERAYQDYHH